MIDYELYHDSAYTQGDIGEIITALTLRESCKMHIERNVYIPINSRYTEIDMIGITKLGVFVIENKNYSGKIIGDINDKYWKVMYSKFNSYRLYNPVLQNLLHKEAVESYLINNGFSSVPIFRPVIFNDKGIIDIKNSQKLVFTLSSFVDAYNSVDKSCIDDYTMKNLIKLFHRCSNLSQEMREVHLSLLGRSD